MVLFSGRRILAFIARERGGSEGSWRRREGVGREGWGVRTRVKAAERGCEGGGLGWREGEGEGWEKEG